LDFTQDQGEALLAEAIHLGEHSVTFIVWCGGPSGFDLMTAVE
jgi:hypothetical protein